MGGSLKRVPQHEILDGDSVSPEAVIESLGDLRMVNRWFGGVSHHGLSVARCNAKIRVAFGFRAGSCRRRWILNCSCGQAVERRRNLEVEPLCLDRRDLRCDAHCCERAVVGDALELAFPPASFDFVSCGLFVHHLAPAQVIDFVNRALTVARYAVLINDLRRSPLHLALVYLGMPLFRSPISRTDGLASVRQAYTPEELRELIGQTKARSSEIRMRYLFRMGAIAWK